MPEFLGVPVSSDVRAADDFDAFVNDAWKASHPIPNDQSTWGVLHHLSDQVLTDCRDLILGPDAPPAAAALAASFEDKTAREDAGLKPIEPLLSSVTSALSDAKTGCEGVLSAACHLHKSGVGAVLFSFYAEADAKDSSRELASFGEGGGLGLPDRDYYLEDDKGETREKYKSHIAKVLLAAGLGGSAPSVEEAASLVLALETDLARGHWSLAEKRDPVKTYHRFECGDGDAEVAFLVDGFIAGYARDGKAEGRFLVDHPEWFSGTLAPLANDASRAVAWRCFFEFHTVRCMSAHLTPELDDLHFAFYGRELQGQREQKPAWKRIVLLCNAYLRDVVGRAYAEKFFPAEAKQSARAMIEHVLAVFKDNVSTLDWMTEATKAKAIEKINAIGVKIGFPDKWETYPGLDLDPKAPFAANMLQLMRIREDREAARLNAPVDPTRWEMPCQLVNAYFHPTNNEICFPAAILQPPLFVFDASSGRLDVPVSFGAAGAVIAHEITHATDDSGRKYDSQGELNDWWTPEDEESFGLRLGLIVQQFSAYEVDVTPEGAEERKTVKVNGQLCAGENIADLGGVNIAFKAMKRYMEENGRPQDEEGWTPEQRFFLAWGRAWATNIRPARAEQLITVDPHSPAQWRVRGPLSVLPEFYEHFGVSEGDKMFVPEDKRPKIW